MHPVVYESLAIAPWTHHKPDHIKSFLSYGQFDVYFVKNPYWVTLLGPMEVPECVLLLENKSIKEYAARGHLFTIIFHHFRVYLILIRTKVYFFLVSLLSQTSPNYTHKQIDECNLMIIKTLAKNAKPVNFSH